MFNKNAQLVIATPGSFIGNFLPKNVRGKEVTALCSKAGIKLVLVDEADHFNGNKNDSEELKKIISHLGNDC